MLKFPVFRPVVRKTFISQDKDIERKLICHVPDLCVFTNETEMAVPGSIDYLGVLLFADVSGFTALTEKYTVTSERGADALTVTLNDYIGQIVDHILTMGGDVLKFAGDAILALWKVRHWDNFPEAVAQVIKCSLIIQDNCDNQETDVGVKLRVKIAISGGNLKSTFLGTDEIRQFVMTGRPVGEVNRAEKHCVPGLVVLSPNALSFVNHEYVIVKDLPDGCGMVKFLIKQPRITWEDYVFLPPNLDYADDEKKFIRHSMKIEANAKREGLIRCYISPVVRQKLDDDQPLKYLSECRTVSICFINLCFIIDPYLRSFHDIQTQTMQTSFLIIQEQMMRLNGAINKIFMFDKGCTLLCIFGLPGDKHEMEPAHALCAAYRIKCNLHKTLKNLEYASLGVTTGQVFCGVIGHPARHEYTVIGQKVNLAARLMMHYPNIVSCDYETYSGSRLSPDIFKTLPPKQMKGVGNIVVYRYNEKVMKSIGTTVVVQPKYPLVGFIKEVGVFSALLEDLNGGKGDRQQIYALKGEAGCGKTRLADEFKWIACSQEFTVYSFSLSLNHYNVDFYMIRVILENLMGLHPDGPTGEEYEAAVLEKLDGGLHDSKELLDMIMQTKFTQPKEEGEEEGGGGEEDEADEEAVTSKLYAMVNSLAVAGLGDNKAIIIIDDAHHIDLESWKLLFAITDNTNILIYITFLPLPQKMSHNTYLKNILMSTKTLYENMSGLQEKDLNKIACQTFKVSSLPEELQDSLTDRCYGVPLWYEMLLTDMQNSGVIILTPEAIHDGALRKKAMGSTVSLAGKMQEDINFTCSVKEGYNLQKFPVPPSIRAVAVTRLDRLLPYEQLVVKCAAVVGEVVTIQMMKNVIPNLNVEKLASAFKELILSRVFECNVIYQNRQIQRVEDAHREFDEDDEEGSEIDYSHLKKECFCGENEESCSGEMDVADLGNSLKIAEKCQQTKFTNFLLQETAYNLWLEDQRMTLHKACADYLQDLASRIVTNRRLNKRLFDLYQETKIADEFRIRVIQPIEDDMNPELPESQYAKKEDGEPLGFEDSIKSFLRDPSYVRTETTLMFFNPNVVEAQGVNVDFFVSACRAEDPVRRKQIKSMYRSKEAFKGMKSLGCGKKFFSSDSFDSAQEVKYLIRDQVLPLDSTSEMKVRLQTCNPFQLHEVLLLLYRETIHHLARSDDETADIVEFLLKGIQSALATSCLKISNKLVRYTQEFIVAYESGRKKIDDGGEPVRRLVDSDRKATMYSLMSQIYFYHGHYNEALPPMLKTLKMIGEPIPQSAFSFNAAFANEVAEQQKRSRWPDKFFGKMDEIPSRQVPRTLMLLSFAYRIYLCLPKFGDRYKYAKYIAMRMVALAESADNCISNTILAYSYMIHINRLMGEYHQSAVFLVKGTQSCQHHTKLVSDIDLHVVGQFHLLGCELKMAVGAYEAAFNACFRGLSVGLKIKDYELQAKILTTLASAGMATMKGLLVKNSLAYLKHVSVEYSNAFGAFQYYSVSMRLMLHYGYMVENPLNCMNYFMQRETPLTDHITVFELRCLSAVWNYRRGDLIRATSWFRLALTVIPVHFDSLTTVEALLSLGEAALHELRKTVLSKPEGNVIQLSRNCTKNVMRIVMQEVQPFPTLHAKAHHFNAWHHLLQLQPKAAKAELNLSISIAKKLQLDGDLQWAELSKRIWFEDELWADAEQKLKYDTSFPDVREMNIQTKLQLLFPFRNAITVD